MKRFIALAFALLLVFALTACNMKDLVQNAVKGAVSGTEKDDTKPSGTTAADVTTSGGEWEQAKDWAHSLGWDGEGYRFPQVDNMREMPPASLWAELGLPDMTPDEFEDGEIYNDGNVHIDGYSDAFVAQCSTEEANFYALAQKLWDAGINGVNPGHGRIIPAQEQDWLIDDDPNYLWYRAYYEHKGDVMEVYLQYTNGWDDKLWIGVIFAPSNPNFEYMDKISWPASEIKALTGVELPSPKGTIYGSIDMDEYRSVELIVEGLSQADYESYLQKLKGESGILLDDNGSSWSFYGEYGYAFYPKDYESFPAYIDVNYAHGLLFIAVYEI